MVIQGFEYQNCPISTFSSGDKVVKTLGSCGKSWEKTLYGQSLPLKFRNIIGLKNTLPYAKQPIVTYSLN